jgi:competence protein ComEA
VQNFAAGHSYLRPARSIIGDMSCQIPTTRLVAASVFLLASFGCTTNQKQGPDQVREKTAEATSALKQDTKAVAQGVREGLKRDKLVDLNQASKEQIQTLPGITQRQADRIIAERPYKDPEQLVSRRILSQQQYDELKDKVVVRQTP